MASPPVAQVAQEESIPAPAVMKATVVEVNGKLLVPKEVTAPDPGFGQILIKEICTGVCHTHSGCMWWPGVILPDNMQKQKWE